MFLYLLLTCTACSFPSLLLTACYSVLCDAYWSQVTGPREVAALPSISRRSASLLLSHILFRVRNYEVLRIRLCSTTCSLVCSVLLPAVLHATLYYDSCCPLFCCLLYSGVLCCAPCVLFLQCLRNFTSFLASNLSRGQDTFGSLPSELGELATLTSM